jgi:hypothetical protein
MKSKFVETLENIAGVDIYALISFGIFFIFFIIITIWVLKADKNLINEISQLPLDN